MALALTLHLLAALIWVGGMFFAYQCLRPVAADLLEAPQRLLLWNQVFAKFFIWVWLAVATLIATGHGMIALYGGMAAIGKHVHMMLGLGYLMIGLFMHVYFALYRKFQRLVETKAWPEAGDVLNKMRKLIGLNLVLGLLTVSIASGGRFLL